MASKRKKPPKSDAPEARTSAAGTASTQGRQMQRRQVLKGVVAGSGVVASAMALPKEWTKPVIQSVVASAQAQVSPPVPLAPLSPAAPPTVLAPTMAPTAPPTMAPTAILGPIGP